MMAGSETESYNLSVAASHEVDLWGKMSRAHEAARADLEASIENRNIIIQSITAETVTLYLQMEALERRIHIARDLVTSYRKSVRTIEGRYRRGLTSILDLKQAQRALAGGESALPQLRQELGSVQHLLSVILGRYPESSPPRRTSGASSAGSLEQQTPDSAPSYQPSETPFTKKQNSKSIS